MKLINNVNLTPNKKKKIYVLTKNSKYDLTDKKPGIAELLLHVLDLGVLVVLRLLEQRRLVDQVLDLRLHLRDVKPRNRELFLDLTVRSRRRGVRLL